MSVADQKLFTDAVAKAKAGQGFFGGTNFEEWIVALQACNRLAMSDLLRALESLDPRDVIQMQTVETQKSVMGERGWKRLWFARTVVWNREIEDQGLPDDQVNDAREFLGCTRLDDGGVHQTINHALNTAGALSTGDPCCGPVGAAWSPILVNQRRVPGASLIANLAAAAHYMLARYHVCAAKAAAWQMKIVIDGYDAKKRGLIADGDKDLKGVALTGNRPFPPDFAIRNWAYKGADDGEVDRLRCNSKAIRSVFPDVNGQEL
jgi:hypothetical protein